MRERREVKREKDRERERERERREERVRMREWTPLPAGSTHVPSFA